LRVRFTVCTPEGTCSDATLETGKSREVSLRLGEIAGTVYIVAKGPRVNYWIDSSDDRPSAPTFARFSTGQ
jgi:hypothetical protein